MPTCRICGEFTEDLEELCLECSGTISDDLEDLDVEMEGKDTKTLSPKNENIETLASKLAGAWNVQIRSKKLSEARSALRRIGDRGDFSKT